MKSVFVSIYHSDYRVHQMDAFSRVSLDNYTRASSWNEVLQLCKESAPIFAVEILVYSRDGIPLEFPDCTRLMLEWRWEPFESPWIDGLSKIPSLQDLYVGNIKFDRVPSSLRLKSLILTCRTPPYWLLETTGLQIKNDGDRLWEDNLCKLRDLLPPFLMRPQSRFGCWLTRGLYDPRLLFQIRDFLL